MSPCDPHDLTLILRLRGRIVGRLCRGCGAVASPSGGGFTDGSLAHRLASQAAAWLDPAILETLPTPVRRRLARARRHTPSPTTGATR